MPLRLAIIAAYDGDSLVVPDITSGGALHVADTGSGMETVEVFNGTATDTMVALGVATPSSRVTIEVLTNDLAIKFVNAQGTASDTIALTPGVWEWDFTYSDIQVSNETAGQNSTYQIVTWN